MDGNSKGGQRLGDQHPGGQKQRLGGQGQESQESESFVLRMYVVGGGEEDTF